MMPPSAVQLFEMLAQVLAWALQFDATCFIDARNVEFELFEDQCQLVRQTSQAFGDVSGTDRLQAHCIAAQHRLVDGFADLANFFVVGLDEGLVLPVTHSFV